MLQDVTDDGGVGNVGYARRCAADANLDDDGDDVYGRCWYQYQSR